MVIVVADAAGSVRHDDDEDEVEVEVEVDPAATRHSSLVPCHRQSVVHGLEAPGVVQEAAAWSVLRTAAWSPMKPGSQPDAMENSHFHIHPSASASFLSRSWVIQRRRAVP